VFYPPKAVTCLFSLNSWYNSKHLLLWNCCWSLVWSIHIWN